MFRKVLASAVLASFFAVPAHASDVAGGELTFNLGATVSSNSRVAFLQGGGATAEGDNSLAVALGGGYERAIGANGKLSLSYGWTSTRYESLGSRDNDLQTASAVYTHRIGVATVGVSHARAWYDLDGSSFMEMANTSAFLGAPGPFGTVLVGRYTLTETELEGGLAYRDADTDTLGLTVRRRLGPVTLTLGYAFADSDAVADELDRETGTLSASLSHVRPLLGQPLTLVLNGSRSARDYDAVNPVIGAVRDDEQTRIGFTLSRPFASGLTLRASVSDLSATSNLPSADYDQTTVSLGVSMNF